MRHSFETEVFKYMATIRKRSEGTYQIRVSCGYGVDGKQRNQFKSYKPEPGMTPKQIEKELTRQAVLFEEECKRGQITSAVKFEKFAEQWFEEYAKLNLRNTSYERMKQLTVRVYPAIGHLRLDKITSRHIQQFINDLALNGKSLKNGKPLSRKTAVHHLSFISDVFSYAVKMEMLSDNPCRKVTIPKGEVKEKPIYSQEEIAQLLTAINGEDTKYRAFFFLIAYSGFRRSEMLGLEWKDIDFENNIISIKRTSNYTAERGIYTDTTKTKRSKRVLKISPYIMGILKELKDEQDEEALRLGDKWVESDRLFVKWNSEPMNNQTPYGWLKEFCEKNDMPFYGIHSFRHFAASALISAVLDVVTVSGALGHCNSGTTLNVYAHMFQTAQARVAQAMDGAFSFLPQDTTT